MSGKAIVASNQLSMASGSVEGCFRFGGTWESGGDGLLLVKDRGKVWRFEIRDNPMECVSHYQQLCYTLKIAAPPRVVFVRSAGGYASVACDGLIAVGCVEVGLIVGHLWHNYRGVIGSWWCDYGAQRSVVSCMFSIAAGVLVSHQLGHLVCEQVGRWGPFSGVECGADFVAGALSHDVDHKGVVSRLVAGLIGADGVACSHDPLCGRAHAFVTGREQGFGLSSVLA